MPRPNKIEIFVDENRMSPKWKKGRKPRGKRKHNGCVVYRERLKKGQREAYSGKAVEVENRGKKRDAGCGR